MEPIEVSPVDVVRRDADSKGRVTVGADYAGQTVTVAVIEAGHAERPDRADDQDDGDGDDLASAAEQAVGRVREQIDE